MEPVTLQFIAESCAGRIESGPADLEIRGVSTDSRTIEAGDLFIPLAGPNFDAHDFLADVGVRGAAAAMAIENRALPLPPDFPVLRVKDTKRALGSFAAAYRKQFSCQAIAVAGSNGKTTTKELLASVLSQKFDTLASAASFNNDIGVPSTLLKLENRHRAGVFEAGTNHPGELRPLLEMIHPAAGVITSIGREHLEFFGTVEGVLEEEGTLAAMLPSSGFLVINGDGFGAEELVRRSAARVIRVGEGPENDWRISDVEMGAEGTRFVLTSATNGFSGEYVTRLLGTHQVVNATFAIVVGKELGLGRAEIQRGLASCRGAKMRLQLKRIDDFLLLDDAYNANADSMDAALDTLRSFPCQGRRIAVLGDMAELGQASATAHQEVGRRAAQDRVDCLIAIGPNSRLMADAARDAGLRDVLHLPEIEAARKTVSELVRPGDVVLVKASRSARLERVIEFLEAKFGSSERGHT